jgi:hypothetical protein
MNWSVESVKWIQGKWLVYEVAIHLHLVPRLRISGIIHPLPMCFHGTHKDKLIYIIMMCKLISLRKNWES